MIMSKRICNSIDCVGCMACSNICPKNAIEFIHDDKGFLIPNVNLDTCIDCGLCSMVCQKNGIQLNENHEKAYIALSKDKKLYKNSASGGIFSTIAYHFLKCKNSYVCGAAYINGEVRHILIDDVKDLFKLQGSKYVQSFIGSVYVDIKKMLEKSYRVLFSGTPCQVQALYLFLGRKYDNLFTIDLICHGVPSQQFLKKSLEQYMPIDKIKNVRFRKKNYLFKSKSNFILSINDNKNIMANRDVYYSMFIKNLSFRDSCYDCKFAKLDRCADITIGDCDSYKKYTNFHVNEATSTVILNNLNGTKLWNEFANFFDFMELDLVAEASVNTQLSHPSTIPFPEIRASLVLDTMDYDNLKKIYTKDRDMKEKIALFVLLYSPLHMTTGTIHCSF